MTQATRQGYRLELDEDFSGDELDTGRWLPHYLPQWSTRERSAARYTLEGGSVRLRIEPDQEPWCPEYDGRVRVSSLQTGVFSGPAGSTVGQHRFAPGMTVREEWAPQRLYTPQYGVVELRAAFPTDDGAMGALWMIGIEDVPEHSAEICVCEVFGAETDEGSALVGMGVHPFGDPSITDDFEKVRVDVDVREPHDYAAEWTPEGVSFFVDGTRVKQVAQSPAYPMQLMLGIYDFGDGSRASVPEMVVHHVRGYRPDSG